MKSTTFRPINYEQWSRIGAPKEVNFLKNNICFDIFLRQVLLLKYNM